jgi:hypothetical protein
MSQKQQRQRRRVEYASVGDDYMDKRQLKQGAAGWVLLAGLGVAYVISGDFAGWNIGLSEGGWGGLLIATILMALMYTCMVFALAEMSTMIPTAGGGYGFARRALGPLGGFMTGTAILIEYAIAPAAIAVFIGAYVDSLIGIGGIPVYIAMYALFVGIHLYGVGEALKLIFVITAIAAVAPPRLRRRDDPEVRRREPDEHRSQRRGRRLGLPAVRLRRHPRGVRLRHLVLPGHRGRAARRRGGSATPRATCREASSSGCSCCSSSPP